MAVFLWVGAVWAGDVGEGFRNPPSGMGPHTYWFWQAGNVTREGITADMEAARNAGIAGLRQHDISAGPPGPVVHLSTEWLDLVKHAASEAKRLGLEFTMHADAGWTGLGGPWVKPEQSMQILVWSERPVEGGKSFRGLMPQPYTRLGFYRDIGLFALKVHADEFIRGRDRVAEVRRSGKKGMQVCDPSVLSDGDWKTGIRLEPSQADGGCGVLEYSMKDPLSAQNAEIVFGWTEGDLTAEPGFELQVSEDGRKFVTLGSFDWVAPVMESHRSMKWNASLNFKAQPAGRVYRLISVRPLSGPVTFGELEIHAARRDEVIGRNDVVDLTSQMKPDGTIEWNAPAGKWALMRMGHTCRAIQNHPGPEGSMGLESDKLNPEATEAFWKNGRLGKVIEHLGPLVGTGFTEVHMDSYEIKEQDWTEKFPEEFQKRCGYPVVPWLPALAGRTLEDSDKTGRFRYDFRKARADLWTESVYGRMADLCKAHGLRLNAQAYGPPVDTASAALRLTTTEVEMWLLYGLEMYEWGLAPGPGPVCAEYGLSAGRAMGTPFVSAEALTRFYMEFDLFFAKPVADYIFSTGVNRLVINAPSHQPWLDKLPGMTSLWGLYNRNNTLWNYMGPWHRYLTRCQYLFRQGTPVIDLAYLGAELPSWQFLQAKPLPPGGMSFDAFGAEMLLRNATVKNGRLQVPSGIEYNLLVLQDEPAARRMSPGLARRLRDLVREGLIVFGKPPTGTPGLAESGKGDEEVRAIARELWGEEGDKPVDRLFGKGRVFCGYPMEDVMQKLGIQPDFVCGSTGADIRWNHRRIEGKDSYFVANILDRYEEFMAVFRAGGVPEIWNAETGEIKPAGWWRVTADGRCEMPMRLAPAESCIVVFRPGVTSPDHVTEVQKDGKILPLPPARHSVEVVKAIWGDPVNTAKQMDVTADVKKHVRDGRLFVSASYFTFPRLDVHEHWLKVDYLLDGVPATRSVRGFRRLVIPESSAEQWPEVVVDRDAGGRTIVTAWQNGKVDLKFESGKQESVVVKEVPDSQVLNGGWTVTFDPKWGPTGAVEFAELKDWMEHPDPEIRNYSGAAVYTKSFHLPDGWGAENRRVTLDLGELANLADVRLNGRDLGILWKPPFRVDVTEAIRDGDNHLEITVVNTWANRLIGDEGLPPGKRRTWKTSQMFQKDQALFPAGLLGPVTLHGGLKIKFEQ